MKEKILSILEKNSRISIEELAILIGEKPDDVAKAIDELEKDGIICGYHTMINWNGTPGEKVNALIEVRITPQRGQGFDKIAERIYKYPEVTSVYLMSGGFDLTVFVEGKNLQEVAHFVSSKLATIENVISTGTHFVLKRYKDHGTIMTKQPEKERMLITP